MMNIEFCPLCYVKAYVCHQDENERWHGHCQECGFNPDADGGGPEPRETPLGEEIDGGNDAFAEQFHAQHDDDPNPYAGTYSEE